MIGKMRGLWFHIIRIVNAYPVCLSVNIFILKVINVQRVIVIHSDPCSNAPNKLWKLDIFVAVKVQFLKALLNQIIVILHRREGHLQLVKVNLSRSVLVDKRKCFLRDEKSFANLGKLLVAIRLILLFQKAANGRSNQKLFKVDVVVSIQ